MALDASLDVRRTGIAALRADTALLALVPAVRIYPPRAPAVPVWPFVRWGVATAVPDRATGQDGARIVVSVHAFSKSTNGEDEACLIGKAVARALDGKVLTSEAGDPLYFKWNGAQILPDAEEADAWHSVQDFEVVVVGDAV